MRTFETDFNTTRDFLEGTIQDAIGIAEETNNKELLEKLFILDSVFYTLADAFEGKSGYYYMLDIVNK